MRKIYYQYDPQRRVYRRVFPTVGQRLASWFWRLLLSVLLGGVFFIIYWFVINTPQVGDLMEENSRLHTQYLEHSHKEEKPHLLLNEKEYRKHNT